MVTILFWFYFSRASRPWTPIPNGSCKIMDSTYNMLSWNGNAETWKIINWCFTSLSTSFRSYRDYEVGIKTGSVPLSGAQSCSLIHLVRNSNPVPRALKSGVLTVRPYRLSYFSIGRNVEPWRQCGE